jgi:hypothetical protein
MRLTGQKMSNGAFWEDLKMEKREMKKLGIETSLLGFGCMRFPTTPDGKIDEVAAEKMLDQAMAQGVTYYGIRGGANSYYSSFLIHTDKPCELPPAVDDYFRNLSLRMVTVVEQILYSPTGEIAPEIYKTQYYW